MIDQGVTGKNGLADSLAKMNEHHAKGIPGRYPKALVNIKSGFDIIVANLGEEVEAKHRGFAEKGE